MAFSVSRGTAKRFAAVNLVLRELLLAVIRESLGYFYNVIRS